MRFIMWQWLFDVAAMVQDRSAHADARAEKLLRQFVVPQQANS